MTTPRNSDQSQSSADGTKPTPSMWAPFRHKTFAVMWVATLVANIGSWMYAAACGWLMTNLSPAPLMVSLVQVAATLPMFVLAIPAGALVDIVDKRRFLIFGEVLITLSASAFAILVWLHLVTPWSLLIFAFLVATGEALTAPAWEAVVSLLVPKRDLPMAVAANSVSVNISRAVGPALGGALLGTIGVSTPFVLNAASNLGVIGALAWWPQPARARSKLPPEHFASAIVTGIRHARYNRYLIATLIRAAGFFLFASAYWALLPLVVRLQINGGATLYGMLLGGIGIGAVGTAPWLPRLKERLGADGLGVSGAIGSAIATALFGFAHSLPLALAASLIGWRQLDHLGVQPQRLGADRFAGMGSRAWPGCLYQRDGWLAQSGKRGLGRGGGALWGRAGTLGGGSGRGTRHPVAATLAPAGRQGRRPHTGDELALSGDGDRHQSGTRTGPRHHHLPDRPGRSTRVP